MDAFTTADLKLLLEPRPGPHVSIYLPTHRAGLDVQGDPIHFKNLLREAERRLEAAGIRPLQAEALLEPLVMLHADTMFWQYQAEGLAVFRAGDLFRTYRVPLRVPELTVVAGQFHLKPLLPLLVEDGSFYVLAVSQNNVRLLHGSRQSFHQMRLDGVPRSLEEALRFDEPERQLQFHTGAPPAAGGRRAAMFHGHGTGVDDTKDNILRYFQLVDRGLHRIIGNDRAPLVLAAVQFEHPIYRQANTYPHLVDGAIVGNPEPLSDKDLHAQALRVVAARSRARRDGAVERFHALAGTGLATNDLLQIVPAAHHGRVEALFVANGVQQWGKVDPETGAVAVHDQARPDDDDVLNVAALQALLHGGVVYVVAADEVPGQERSSGLAAIFRY